MEIGFTLPDDKRAPEIIALVCAALSPTIFAHARHLAGGRVPSAEDFAEARQLAIGQWVLTLKTFNECARMTIIPDSPSAEGQQSSAGGP